MFLLDTDHIVFLQRGTGVEYSRLRTRAAMHAVGGFYFPIVSFHEQFLGWNAYIQRAQTAVGVIRGYSMLGSVLRDFTTAQMAPFDERRPASSSP